MSYQVVVFRLGNEKFAVDISSVKEIVRLPEITAVPEAPPHVLGVSNLRGEVTAIYDLRTQLGLSPAETTKESRAIVLTTGEFQVGMLVDAVSETLTIPDDAVDPVGEIALGVHDDNVEGIARLDSGMVILLDWRSVLGDAFAAHGAGEQPLTERQIELVQTTFAQVETIADTAAKLFYQRLFELNPEIKPLFKGVKMSQQRQKLMQTLAVAVKGLEKLDEIAPAVQELGVRHLDYGVREAHYATVGEALLWALEQGLGDDFTPEVRDAWAAVYGVLSSVMIAAAQEAVPEESPVPVSV